MSSWRPSGFLGMGIVLIGLIIGFVVVVEFDPDGVEYRRNAETGYSTVLRVVEAGDQPLLEVQHPDNPEYISLVIPVDGATAERIEVGDERLIWYRTDGVPDTRLDEDVPATPRTAAAFIAPIVILLVGALFVSANPEILYPPIDEAPARG